MKYGIIGGTVLYNNNLLKKECRKQIETPFGVVIYYELDDVIMINRHGEGFDIPPHSINHRANIAAMKLLEIDRLIAICSVGSMQFHLQAGSLMVPDDYMDLFDGPTFFDEEINHVLPEINQELRMLLLQSAKELQFEIIDGGTYFQSKGPRFETKAEIRMFSSYAEIVGMTMGSEASLSREKNISFAGICSIDNMANGLLTELIDFKEIQMLASQNAKKILEIIFHSIKK